MKIIKGTFSLNRAALKGTNLRGQTPICNFLRFSAVSCENLRFDAKMLCLQGKGKNLQESTETSAKICVWARFVPLGSSP